MLSNFFHLSSFFLYLFLLYVGIIGLVLCTEFLLLEFNLLPISGATEKVILASPIVVITMLYLILFPEMSYLISSFATILTFSIFIVKLLRKRARKTS